MNRIMISMLLIGTIALTYGSILGGLSPKTIIAILKNKDAINTYADCTMATEELAKKMCDKTGMHVRATIPAVMAAGGCPSACTDHDKSWLVYGLKTLKENYATIFKQLLEHFKITPEQLKIFEDFLANTPLPPEVATN